MTTIGNSDLDVFGLNLGGNVFGWTADEEQSFAVLDAYTAAGGNFIDTADVYSAFATGNSGGESETIIGDWLRRRGRRDDVVLATKGGALPPNNGTTAPAIRAAAEDSLRRLGTDHIDLYYVHFDDPSVPVEETLGALDELVRAGKLRHIAASNFSAERLDAALRAADRDGLPRYVALQPHYNLVERDYETELADLAHREGLGVLPYYSLAKGFLTGKYRTNDGTADGPRAEGALAYLDERGQRALAALDEVAAAHSSTPTAVSLAWLRQQPSVTAPIASARDLHQLEALLASVELELTQEELTLLSKSTG
ncbi:aldo/keto reductase [Salinifilum aidingensis]